jgi:hypothetical protein
VQHTYHHILITSYVPNYLLSIMIYSMMCLSKISVHLAMACPGLHNSFSQYESDTTSYLYLLLSIYTAIVYNGYMYTLISTYIFKCGSVLAFILLTVYIHTHKYLYNAVHIHVHIFYSISLLTALILYVLYLPKPISPTYTHLYTSSSIQPWVL